MGWDGGRGGLGGREQGAEAQLLAPGHFFCPSLKCQTWNWRRGRFEKAGELEKTGGVSPGEVMRADGMGALTLLPISVPFPHQILSGSPPRCPDASRCSREAKPKRKVKLISAGVGARCPCERGGG